MPGINLAHADLKKYNQAPNHLYIYIYIYIYIWHFKKATQALSTKDRKYHIFSFRF